LAAPSTIAFGGGIGAFFFPWTLSGLSGSAADTNCDNHAVPVLLESLTARPDIRRIAPIGRQRSF
jgi:hypothetical protein